MAALDMNARLAARFRAGGLEKAASGILLGATVTAFLPSLPAMPAAAFLLVCGLALSILDARGVIGWVVSGAGWLALAGHFALAERLPEAQAGEDRVLEGVIASIPAEGVGRLRFVFEPLSPPAGMPRRIRLTWYDAPGIPDAGSRWRLRVRLRPPSGSSNPGTFDYERWLLEQGIGATGYVRRSPENVRIGGPKELAGQILRLRESGARRLREAVDDPRAAAIVQALTLGVKNDLGDATRAVLRMTGTSHLLAISGLHVGIVGGLGALFGRLLWTTLWRVLPLAPGGPGRRAFAALFCGLFALVYTVLAGAGIPSRRALIMLVVVSLVLLARRRRGPWVPIASAVLVLLLWNPLSVLSPGFWLSVTAVAGLTAGAAGFVSRRGVIRGLLHAQLAVWLALFVPGLLIFGGLPVFGPAVNLLAVPVFSLAVVPASLIGIAALAISQSVAEVVYVPVAWVLDAFLWTMEAVAAVPGAWLTAARPPPMAWLPAVPGLALLFAPVGLSMRLMAVLLLAPVALWQPAAPPVGAFRLTVLDVGQGLAAVVQTHSHALLFDAGPAWRGGKDAGEAIVSPFLTSTGLMSIDALVVSHGDIDHRGGVGSVRDRHRIRRTWAGPDALEHVAGARACAAGERWRWDGVEFRFLHPGRDDGARGNNSSCVLTVRARTGGVLLTGDIEGRAERALIARHAELGADLIVAPHHGSRTSSTAGFAAAVDPEWVVFAAGYRNRWGFPAAEVLTRWSDAGALSYSTGESGAVMWATGVDEAPVTPSTWRCRSRRFWRRANCDHETGPQ